MSWLLTMAGVEVETPAGKALAALVAGPVEALPPEAWQVLMEAASRFRAAGGTWTPEVWCALSTAEKEAATEAGERIEAARAMNLGAAIRGGVEAAGVASVYDGGATMRALEGNAVGAAMGRLRNLTRAALDGSAEAPAPGS